MSNTFFKTFHSRKNEKSGTGEGSFTGRDQQTAEGLPDSGNRKKAGKYLAASGWNQRVRAAERCVFGSAL